MNRLLLVEDNKEIMNINATALRMHGYEVISADCLRKAEELLALYDPDMIVLDIMLPDGSGLDWCKKIKPIKTIPILFLSALSESEDIIEGLRVGGDDYLAKPYDLEVLIARIEVRLKSVEHSGRYISLGELQLDVFSRTAVCSGQELPLTQKEFAILQLLLRNGRQNKAISKDKLYETAWAQPMGKDSNALWTVISRLKTKLAGCHSGLTISFTKADGYILERE